MKIWILCRSQYFVTVCRGGCEIGIGSWYYIKKRFPWKVSADDLHLTAKIKEFERMPYETLSKFIGRAIELSEQADKERSKILWDRLYKRMCDSGNEGANLGTRA